MTVRPPTKPFTHWEATFIPTMYPNDPAAEPAPHDTQSRALIIFPRNLDFKYDVDDENQRNEMGYFLRLRFGICGKVIRVRRLRFDRETKSFYDDFSQPSPLVTMLSTSAPTPTA
ncbi:hypothetical protein [Nocardia brasiliensis]|uniref:hypothetical protein n=1 Tax=Nocardia brasiliensis TaxID=37326 RepID=UPI002453F586|nr:hypothetical protein [Nocardia brasiliensis]